MLAQMLRWTLGVQWVLGALVVGWACGHLPLTGLTSAAWLLLDGLAWVLVWQTVLVVVNVVLSAPPPPVWSWWRVFASEFTAALRVYVLRMPWTRHPPEVLPPTHAQPLGTSSTLPPNPLLPVLLVHGLICNHRVWDSVSQALRDQGHSVLAVNLEPLFTSIDDYAPAVQHAVTNLCQTTGSKRVILVGHSMGGLAIRAWMRAHGTHQVAKVITLGTPHQGTRIRQWMPTPNGTQMAWHSLWLAELERSESQATRQLMHLGLSRHDNVVFPQTEQTLAGAHVTEFRHVGHVAMCVDAGVVGWLVGQCENAGQLSAL